MDRIAPDGPVYQAGTLSGNPLAMAAGCATLAGSRKRGVYERLEQTARALADGLRAAAADGGVPFTASASAGMFGFFFHAGPVRDFADAQEGRRRALPHLLRGDARRGHLPGALALRGGLRLAGAPPGGRRGDAATRRARRSRRWRGRVEARGGAWLACAPFRPSAEPDPEPAATDPASTTHGERRGAKGSPIRVLSRPSSRS